MVQSTQNVRRSEYIHEHSDWPRFTWDAAAVLPRLSVVRHEQGRLLGQMEALGFPLRQEARLATLSSDVLKSSEIEGEKLDPRQVRSSLARQLGLDAGGLPPADRYVDGVVEMMLDATRLYDERLTADRLFGWHAALFPSGRSGLRRIVTGSWRDDATGPMQVVSGRIGRERVHFEAPAAARLDKEMRAFLKWFNAKPETDEVLKAALAHLWFVTIHPFSDGNGRIARAIADMALARSERSEQRFYSMSSQIRAERDRYYAMLESTQRGRSLDVTPWITWFLDCLGRAIEGARGTLDCVMNKARQWERAASVPLNDRQRKVVKKLIDGFEGKLTSSKWATLAKTSQDTALRDIRELVAHGLLESEGAGGRSTSYRLTSAGS